MNKTTGRKEPNGGPVRYVCDFIEKRNINALFAFSPFFLYVCKHEKADINSTEASQNQLLMHKANCLHAFMY